MFYRPSFMITITCALLTTAFGETPHAWQYLTGQWTFESSTGLRSDVTWTPKADGKVVVGEWVAEDGTKSSELIGWRADKQAIVVNGIGSKDGFWHIEFDKITATKCEGPGIVAYSDGTVVEGTHTIEKVDDDRVKGRLEGKDAQGESALVTWTWTRQAETESAGASTESGKLERQDFERFVEAWEGRWTGQVIPVDQAEDASGSEARVTAYFDGHALHDRNALIGTYYAGDFAATWLLSYDPTSKVIRSTWIGSNGVNSHGTMTSADDRWILRDAGLNADGIETSFVGTIAISDGGETHTWTNERTIDGKPQDSEVEVWHRVSRP